MIQRFDPRLIMTVGMVLMLLGFALPVLIIMKYLPSTFFLNFASYIASFLGLVMGFVGIVMYVGNRRRRE